MKFAFVPSVPTASAPLTGDRYTIIHLVLQLAVAALFFFANDLNRIFKLYPLLIPILILPPVIVAGIWVVSVVANSSEGRARRFVSAMAAPLIVLCLWALLSHWRIDSEWVRFHVNQQDYVKYVASLKDPHPRHVTWNWGGVGGVAVANIFYELHYDETDLTMRRNGIRVDTADVEVRAFGNHFYLVTFIYQ